MRALEECGYVSFKEPFTGLLAQGMVCHETYKDDSGWLYPEEVEQTEAGNWQRRDNGRPVQSGRSESMSKSKKNVVDPGSILKTYGADTARLFMLSDSPPERDIEWTESGIEGAWKFVQKVWRLVESYEPIGGQSSKQHPQDSSPQVIQLRKHTHQTIATVTKDIESFRFNRAVAGIRQLANAIAAFQENGSGAPQAKCEALETLVKLIGPMLPHLAEEMWEKLGFRPSLAQESWPLPDTSLLSSQTVTMAVQINGKLRTTLNVATDITPDQAQERALADPVIKSHIGNREIKKVVVVPNRVINVVL
tara:strand:- start:52 stop:972 length:921 start_codon:yes stop_codon:yes gene_type:complete